MFNNTHTHKTLIKHIAVIIKDMLRH